MRTDDLRKTLRFVGIVTRAELLATGLSREHIATSVRRGSLIRLGRGVYARAAIARNYLSQTGGEHMLRVAAALAVVGPGAVASHQSAARLFRIDLLGPPGSGVTLTCPPERGWRSRAGIHLHAVELPTDHVTTCLRLPTATAARTVVDLARTLDFRAAVVAADSALHRKLTTKDELEAVLNALPSTGHNASS